MENITTTAGLKNAIQLLEVEQTAKGQLFKEQFHITCESLRPVNLLKCTLKDISSSPYLIDNILGTVIGLATGYVSKGMVVGRSVNKLRKLFGTILQFGITNVVTQNSEAIRSFGQSVFKHIFRKKERIPS